MKTASLSMVLAALAILTPPRPAQASLGESPQECARRYGTPVPTTARALPGGIGKPTEYLSALFRISVVFAKGRAASHCYTKLDGDLLTVEEMQDLMAENGDGSTWSGPLAAKTTDGSPAMAYRCGQRILATYYFDKDKGRYCFFFVRAAVDLPS